MSNKSIEISTEIVILSLTCTRKSFIMSSVKEAMRGGKTNPIRQMNIGGIHL